MKVKNSLYTDKQNEILKRTQSKDWFMLILHGAVRAGKTVLDNDLFLLELLRVKENAKKDGVKTPMYILAATTSGALQNNVLQELTNKYGIEFKFDRYNNFTLFGVKVITTFTETIRGLSPIRGMTSYGAYINEASLANKEVFDEIRKRCSGSGARIIADTNPDHPGHWLKVDYIDKADGSSILEYNFTIHDNSFLNQRYIDNIIQTTPSGVMTERGIYGRWTAGEGAIYKDFKQEEYVISSKDVPWNDITEYVVGVDWGYEHYGVMNVIAVDSKENHYLIEEHAHQHKHIDFWVKTAKKLAKKYGKDIPFWCDSARPEYVDALEDAGLNAENAYKAVIPGITEVGSLIKLGKLFVLDTCERWLYEVNQYTWNKKGDKPEDKDDDSQDATRYAVYSRKMDLNDNWLY